MIFETGTTSIFLDNTKNTFERVLIPKMEDRAFADMYAQTVAYGLFVARIHHSTASAFDRINAAHSIPSSIPFLRRLFDSLAGLDLDQETYVSVVDEIAEVVTNH